jgi:hypothetical protein
MEMKKKFMKKSEKLELKPDWVTGFSDAKGCFSISFTKRPYRKVKLEIRPSFSVTQLAKSKQTLEYLRGFFNCGAIRYSKRDVMFKYEVRSIEDLVTKIIPHFKNFPLCTNKAEDFKSFQKICELVYSHHHVAEDQLRVILKLAFSMNSPGKGKYSYENLLKLIAS